VATSSENSFRYTMSCILPEYVSGSEGRYPFFLVLLSLIMRMTGLRAPELKVMFGIGGGEIPPS